MTRRSAVLLASLAVSLCGCRESVRTWTEDLRSDSPDRRGAAIRALGEVGPAAAPAVPALLDALGDDRFVEVAAWALGEIGPAADAAVPRLIELAHEGPPLRLAVLGIALGKIGANNAEVDECLQRLAQSPVVLVRQAAAGAMRGRR